jgi:serine/threonine protein kinase
MKTGDAFTCLIASKKHGTVVRFIASGGEADLLEVKLGSVAMALKLFYPIGSTPEREQHCRWLIDQGAPHPAFVYPIDLVRTTDGRLGIVMPLIPESFHEASSVHALPDAERPSLRSAVKACLNIALAFYAAIRAGLIYIDASSAQMMIDVSGAVKIVDVTNIVDQVTPSLNLRTFGYASPELWLGKTLPSVATGRYSLGVVFFELLFAGHPLFGRRLPRILGPDDEHEALHVSPTFIFDPSDDSNRPDPVEHAAPLVYWPIFPQKLHDLFTRHFTAGLRDPNRRVIEIEWIDAFYDAYTACFQCSCGAEVFHDPSDVQPFCWNCGSRLSRPARLKFVGGRETVLSDGELVTRYDVTGRQTYDFTPVGRVICHALSPGSVELENLSSAAWTWRRRTGVEGTVVPGKRAPLYRDVVISFAPGSTATVAE